MNQDGPSGLKKPPPSFRAIEPERPQGTSSLTKVFLLCLLGVGIYGGYYGYCVYKVGEREHAMSKEMQDLHQALMRLAKNIDEDDVSDVVKQMAENAGVEPVGEIAVSIEPMNDTTAKKLPSIAQTGLGIAAKIPGHNKPQYVVGFIGEFHAKHGIAKRTFTLERYTWFQWVASSAASP